MICVCIHQKAPAEPQCFIDVFNGDQDLDNFSVGARGKF